MIKLRPSVLKSNEVHFFRIKRTTSLTKKTEDLQNQVPVLSIDINSSICFYFFLTTNHKLECDRALLETLQGPSFGFKGWSSSRGSHKPYSHRICQLEAKDQLQRYSCHCIAKFTSWLSIFTLFSYYHITERL